jgi:hypothetical protein
VCYDRPEKLVAETVISFHRFKAIEGAAIREFYSLLRSTIMSANAVGLTKMLINAQTLSGIMKDAFS